MKKPLDPVSFYCQKGIAESYRAYYMLHNTNTPIKNIKDILQKQLYSLCPKNGLLVDLGCGPGTSASEILSICNFEELMAVDVSLDMISYMEKEYADGKIKLRTQVADLRKDSINLQSNSADFILSCGTILYLNTLENLFSEAGRILKNGKIFSFSALTHDLPNLGILRSSSESTHEVYFYVHNSKALLSLVASKGFNRLIVICHIDDEISKMFGTQVSTQTFFMMKNNIT